MNNDKTANEGNSGVVGVAVGVELVTVGVADGKLAEINA